MKTPAIALASSADGEPISVSGCITAKRKSGRFAGSGVGMLGLDLIGGPFVDKIGGAANGLSAGFSPAGSGPCGPVDLKTAPAPDDGVI